MKVIFIEDVPNVANAGETKDVADGYGRNFLLPRKLAVLANSQGSAVLESQLKRIAQKRAQAEAEMAEVAGKLDGVEITLKARAGVRERLYGSVTSADIANELSRQAGSVVDKRKIELAEPIRQLGSYAVTVRFTHEIAATVKLTIVSDEAVEEKEEKKAEVKKGKKAKEKAEKKSTEKAEKEVEEVVKEKVEESVEKLEETEDKVAEVDKKVEEAEPGE